MEIRVVEVVTSVDFMQLELRIAAQPLHVNAAAWTYAYERSIYIHK